MAAFSRPFEGDVFFKGNFLSVSVSVVLNP
jgi:hypothetical protein